MSSKQMVADGENLEKRLIIPNKALINSVIYPQKVYTNVNNLRRRELLDLMEELDDQKPFLNYNKPLILVDKSTGPMQYFVDHLIEALQEKEIQRYEIKSPHYGHHIIEERRPIVAHLLENMIILGRVKGTDSLVEKIAKTYNEGDPTASLHDIYGFKLICENEQDIALAQKKLKEMQDLQIYKEEHINKITGYKAIHYDTRWNNGNAKLNGSNIELQLKTLEQAKQDFDDHGEYAKRRLTENGHADLTPFQIVIYDNRAEWKGPIHYENENYAIANVTGNKFADYWLIMQKGGEQPDPMTKLKNPLELLK